MAGGEGPVLETEHRTRLQQLARDELPGLYALAWHLAGPQAEDLVQEALLRACRSIDSLRDPDRAGGWLRVILTNVWRDRLRQQGREPAQVPVDEEERFSLYQQLLDEDPYPYSDTMHLDVLGSFSRRDIHLVLQRLPDHYRAPLVLRYVEELSTEEIAEALDEPIGTVCSQLQRGRKRFERELWTYAEESGLVPASTDGPAPPPREVGHE